MADIVDPHATHLGDSLQKLKGLAAYAEANANTYRRVEAVAKIDDTFRVLDLTEASVRAAVDAAENAEELYKSDAATDYVIVQ